MVHEDFSGLDAIFAPSSVAVIGASTNPSKIGGLPVAFMKSHDFKGEIYPVNPSADTIQGLKAYGDIRDIKADIDLAICAVPQALAEKTVRDCADKKIGGLIMFTSGFAEVDDSGAAAQERMAATARESGMRLAGPNCMGMANMQTGAIASFHPAFAANLGQNGKIGLVSQSGAFGGLCTMMANRRGIAFSNVITTGNEADIEAADGLMFLARQPQVDVIMMYIEGVRDGARFLQALECARDNKKIVIAIKLGRTEAGSEAAASHTAALAGHDEVYEAIFRQYGVYRANSIEEFFDIGCAAAIGGLPRNEDVGLVTVSGGVGVLMADDASGRGLNLPALQDETQSELKKLVPFAGTRNPVDITGQILNDMSLLQKAMDLVIEDSDFGSVVMFQGAALTVKNATEKLLPSWIDIAKRNPGCWLSLSGLITPEIQKTLDDAGIPSFAEPTHATRAIAALAGIRTAQSRPLQIPQVAKSSSILPASATEVEALDVLKAANLTVPDVRTARTAQEAAIAAEAIGFPVVLKILSPDIIHKSDIGGVKLNLSTAGEVREGFDAILAAVKTHAPDAKIQGCLVAPMVFGGVETILGVSQDPVFGPVVMFGLGGVFVEAMGDVSFRVAPFDVTEAQRMIDETKGSKLLSGYRGAPPADRDALAKALSDLSIFAATNRDQLESAEANPFLVRPTGQGAIALDAVLIATPHTATT